MRAICAIVLVGLICGCASSGSVLLRSQGPEARRVELSASQDALSKAKASWKADPMNAAKRKVYDDAVAAHMEKVGKAK